MKKLKSLKSYKKKAFTLIELLIVIAILAVLVLIAIPRYNNSRIKADKTAHATNIRVLETAAIRYLSEEKVENPTESKDITQELVSKKYIKEIPKVPKSIKGSTTYTVTIQNGEVTITPASEEIND